MSSPSEPAVSRRPEFFSRLATSIAGTLIVSGLLTLLAWFAAFSPMQNLIPGLPADQPDSAVGFIAAGLALWLSRRTLPANSSGPERLMWRFPTLLSGCVVLALGCVLFAEHLGLFSFGIDQWYPRAGAGLAGGEGAPVAPLSAACFMLAGISLLLLDTTTRNGHHPAEYCALGIVGVMSIPLINYLYSIAGAGPAAQTSAVAPLTAVLFILFSFGILSARPAHNLMAVWNSDAPGGQLLRKLLPKSLLLLVAIDLISQLGARQGLYSAASIAPLVTILTTIFLAVLFWRAGSILNREYIVRRKGESALFETSAMLHTVSENTPDVIFVKDRQGRMVFANPAAFRMLGKEREEVIGHGSREIYGNAADAETADANDLAVMASGHAHSAEESVRTSGEVRTFHFTRAPWFNDAGQVAGVVGIGSDITDRKRVEVALKAHETHLESLVAARTAEVSELMAHLETTREEEKSAIARELHDDLGSALTALNMHLAILSQQLPADPRLTDRLQQVKTLLNQVTQSTRRIQAGLRPDKLDAFGIKIAIADQVLEFENYTGVPCRASLPDEDLAYGSQTDIALFRMVQEALNNVAKHASATQVDVVLDDIDEQIVLTVRDNGIGMAPGWDISSSRTHGLRGMRERASYLGGEVRIASRPGGGTTVIITLPKRLPDTLMAASA